MYWESDFNMTCPIDAGGTASIVVGEVSRETRPPAIIKDGLAFFKVGTQGEQTFGVSRGVRTKHDNSFEVTVEDASIVEITITASPSLLQPWGTHCYEVKVDGRITINEITKPLAPNREDSETEEVE